jgi:predicted alpha/beta hydrolase family esterase
MSLESALQDKLDGYDVLVLPGWKNSGPRHWQTRWEDRFPSFRRVQQENWLQPQRDDWVAALEGAVAACRRPVVLVAHSLGCITAAHWAARHDGTRVAAALLVAPADVERSTVARSLKGFAPIPATALPFPTLLVTSDNDPACAAWRAACLAEAWQAKLQVLPGAGHINADSGLGDWDAGLRLLDAWLGRQRWRAAKPALRFRWVA